MQVLSQWGSRHFVGLGGYMLFALTVLLNLDAMIALPIAGLVAGLAAIPTAFVGIPLARAIFRHWHLGGHGSVSPRAGAATSHSAAARGISSARIGDE